MSDPIVAEAIIKLTEIADRLARALERLEQPRTFVVNMDGFVHEDPREIAKQIADLYLDKMPPPKD